MNTNKYVPPNKRTQTTETSSTNSYNNRRPYRKPQWQVDEDDKKKKQEEELKKKNEFNEDNFPALGPPVSKQMVWGGPKSFAVLAVEWDEKSKKEEVEKKQDDKEDPTLMFRRRNALPLPQFHNVHRFVEPEDEDDYTEQAQEPPEDEWTLVDRKKYRREKTIEEKLERPPSPEPGDSVWDNDGPDDRETCWDERN